MQWQVASAMDVKLSCIIELLLTVLPFLARRDSSSFVSSTSAVLLPSRRQVSALSMALFGTAIRQFFRPAHSVSGRDSVYGAVLVAEDIHQWPFAVRGTGRSSHHVSKGLDLFFFIFF